jgi:cysteine desulfurase
MHGSKAAGGRDKVQCRWQSRGGVNPIADQMTYLDWAASSPPESAALDEAREVAALFYANPSSPHAAGRAAEEKLSQLRARCAKSLGIEPKELIFTSGGTESNTALLLALLDRHRLGGVERQKVRIVTTAIEHSSVYEQAQGLQGHGIACTVVRPGPDGRVSPEELGEALSDDTVMVSAMLVNNETGAIQDVAAFARLVREHSARKGRRILVHTDAVQALAKIPLSLRGLDVDAASFSGHKIGAPRGIGALYVRAGNAPGFLSLGGGQEAGRRPGTENLPGIAAFTAALELRLARLPADAAGAQARAQRLIEGLREIRGAWLLPLAREGGSDLRFSPWIVSAGFPPLPAEVVVRTADEAGFFIASGAACSSKKKDRTRVPESMGLPLETARCMIRISTGPSTSSESINAFIAMMQREIPPLAAIARGRA